MMTAMMMMMTSLIHVITMMANATHGNRESIFESDCGKKHLDADEEVLVTSGHRARLQWQWSLWWWLWSWWQCGQKNNDCNDDGDDDNLGGDAAIIRDNGLNEGHLLQDHKQEALHYRDNHRNYYSLKSLTIPCLPIWEEDDTFDGEELENRIVRPQKVFGGKIEEEESVESHRDAAKDLFSYMIIFIIWSSSKVRRHGAK